MSDHPLISFIVFAYNQERLVAEAVTAAFGQTWSPLEIVLSDDCSRDGTHGIMQRMAEDYRGPHTVRVNRNASNLGVGGHTNHACMDLCSGDLIVLAAGDDVSLPQRTETVYRAWDESGRKARAILSGYTLMSEEGRPIRDHRLPRGFVSEGVGDYLRRNRSIYAPGCVLTCHRDVFAAFGPLTAAAHLEDNSLVLRARMLGEVLLLDDVLVNWRQAGAVSKHKSARYMWEQEEMFRRETRQQVLIDLEAPAVRQRLTEDERRRIRAIALAGVDMVAPRSPWHRLRGWLALCRHCPPRESFHNFMMLNPWLGWGYQACRRLADPFFRVMRGGAQTA